MVKSKKGATLVEIMVAVIISSILIIGTMPLFARMYKIRYASIAYLRYLDFAISQIEYRKCYGAGQPNDFPIGIEGTLDSDAQYMAWCVNHTSSAKGVNNATGAARFIIRTEFLCAYPFTKAYLSANNANLETIFDYGSSQIEYHDGGAVSGNVRNFIINTLSARPGAKTIKLVSYYAQNFYEQR
jgi:type II secretory pathway pseudopilin PulG